MFDRRMTATALIVAATLPLAGCGINSIPTAEENAKAKWADVQAALQRRADLIPNVVATVKAAGAQEKGILVEVTQARAAAGSVRIAPGDLTDPAKMAQYANAQQTVAYSLQRLQEAYPELQSQAGYKTVVTQLEGTENRINDTRRRYNEAVQAYNTRIRTFPDAIGATVFYGSKPMAPFEAAAGAQAAPKVDFN
jgi:LemA protein